MYDFTGRCQQLFSLLQDDLSKEIFLARLRLDIEPSMSNAMRVLCLNEASRKNPEERAKRLAWKETVEKLNRSGEKLLLYGAGYNGTNFASLLQYEKVEFYGFCDRRAAALADGVMGKSVVPPEYLFQHADECYVIIAVGDTGAESVLRILEENHFPSDHVLNYMDLSLMKKQYFDFPSLYRRGTAFVDAGCFDCSTDYTFSEWCDVEYSRIFAFEPDPENYRICLERTKSIPRITLFQAGLAERPGVGEFCSKGSGASGLCTSGAENTQAGQTTSVQITTIDESVGSETVGMIKMDIEGAEFAALRGAKNTIQRDKPLLATCVYHRPGDTLAFMDYLEKLVPEYRFWLRQYTGPAAYETVLYASVDPL